MIATHQKMFIGGAAGIIAICLVVWLIGSTAGAQPGTSGALEKLREANARGGQERVVANVDGQPIRLLSVTGLLAFAELAGAADGSGKPANGLTPQGALTLLIETKILASAARLAGLSVTEEEVSSMIQLGQIHPLEDPSIPKAQKELMLENMKLAGTSPETIMTDPDSRRSIADTLLAGKYLESISVSRAEAIAQARQLVDVEIIPGALDTK